ncbi:phosphodiesterase [Pontixanthobacter luteolus]|uniref:phosphodiesterase n=1 Tax=Pontixanthobacter luteolus TaxID=295089 RepID=UPI002FE1FCC4
MLIAQMTDIHIGFDPDAKPEELNRIRFRATLDRLLEGPNAIDMLVLTGDLTDHGDKASFEKTAALLEKCPVPIYSIVGNHDTREGLLHAFPDTPVDTNGFIQYAVEQEGLRILFLDTLEIGRHGGAFCEQRAAWLSAELNAHPDTPTLIFMHHPPVISGIGWMDPGPDEGWMLRFGEAIEGHSQIRAIHCGHLHRPITTTFRGVPLSVTPSVAPLVAMDLRPIDPENPDHRDLITTEPPTYAVHRWSGGELLTHYEKVSDWMVLARYDPNLQGMIQEMFAERE